jgi:hypothetical protein
MAEIQSETCLGATWGQKHCWVQTGDLKTYTHKIREETEGATWQHLIGSSHPCGSHIPDRWVPLMPHGSTTLGHVSKQLTDH